MATFTFPAKPIALTGFVVKFINSLSLSLSLNTLLQFSTFSFLQQIASCWCGSTDQGQALANALFVGDPSLS